MRIESVALALPSRKVANADVLALLKKESPCFAGNIEVFARKIRVVLGKIGTEERYFLGEGETSLGVTLKACRNALDQARSEEVDFVICAGVYGELVEPATANLIAHKLGLDKAECMDLKEACDGWVKAMKVADALFATGAYQRILIVNAEFSMRPGYAIMPDLFRFDSAEQLEWRLPIFTIGEGATATVVTHDGRRTDFTNRTRNDLYDLCTVAPNWFAEGSVSERVGMDGPGRFTSWGLKLSQAGIPLAIEAFRESSIRSEAVDILFTHASSTSDWKEIVSAIGLSEKHFDIHGRTGNLVSASIPAAMAIAVADRRLKRGDTVAVLCASAGMTFSTMYFKY